MLEMTVLLLLALSAVLLVATAAADDDLPRPEHPRPDFQRPLWLHLNGTWQFEIDNDNTGQERGLSTGHDLSGEIVVPFCPESKLSGVGHTDFMNHVWYRRTFRVPAEMAGRRLLLHFGAVEFEAHVWVNGKPAGSHKGGYTPFCLDITALVVDGDNELVLKASDDTRSGLQATGKQSHKLESYGCVYTRTTGIWQTVWLEAAGETWLREYTITPDVDGQRALVQAWVAGPCEGRSLRVQVLDEGRLVSEELVPAAWRSTLAVLPIAEPRLWEPGSPHLYDLKLTVEAGGEVLDEVDGYFGMRKVHIEGNRFLINGKPIFQRLILDQGFYPDGIYTAPSDEALRRDIELSMAAGFNGARLHEKVFEPRTLYWADKLGYLVWGEYPNWGLDTGSAAALTQMTVEWQEVLRRDRNHPAIIGWCPLNETGAAEGDAMAQQLVSVTQLVDPTRPFLDTSGYVHFVPGTDVYDCHNYDQNPESFRSLFALFALTGREPWNNNLNDDRSRYLGQPYFVSEYGGTKLDTAAGEGGAWGYGSATTSVDEFLARYKRLTDALLDNPNMFAFCYTQLTDVEQEQNGVYRYDRTPKYDPALLQAINARPAAYETGGPVIRGLNLQALLATSQQNAQTWRFTTQAPEGDWTAAGYDATHWQEAPGGFGSEGTPGAHIGTEWKTEDIWLRREFEMADADLELVFLSIHHDEDAEVFLNGKQIAGLFGYTVDYRLVDVSAAATGALVAGRNVLAVHCHQTVGGQYIDVGLLGQ